MSDNPTGIEQAVEKAGGRKALGAVLGAMDPVPEGENPKPISEQAVGQWVLRGWVPPERARQIEELYGIDIRLLLKPDLVRILYPE